MQARCRSRIKTVFQTSVLTCALSCYGLAHASEFAMDLLPAPERGKRAVIFASYDIHSVRSVSTLGSKVALFNRLNVSGIRLLGMSAYALRERDPVTLRRGLRALNARLLAGYEWHITSGALSLYLGGAMTTHDSATWLASNKRDRRGAAGLIEYWHNWQDGGLLPKGFTHGTLLVDQAEKSLYLRAKHGFALPWWNASVGPDAALSIGFKEKSRGIVLQSGWRKLRLGAHFSGLSLGSRIQLGVAGGYEFARGARSGAYGTITTVMSY